METIDIIIVIEISKKELYKINLKNIPDYDNDYELNSLSYSEALKYDNYNYYKLIDTNGKLYSNNKEVAKLTDSNQSITAGTMTAPTGNFDNINTSFSNFNALLAEKLQITATGTSTTSSSNGSTNWRYYKLSNGIYILLGIYTQSSSSGDKTDTITYPQAFIDTSYITSIMPFRDHSSNTSYRVTDTTTLYKTTTTLFFGQYGNGQYWKFDIFIIGRWK